jgi:hypothetical protein
MCMFSVVRCLIAVKANTEYDPIQICIIFANLLKLLTFILIIKFLNRVGVVCKKYIYQVSFHLKIPPIPLI